MSERQYNVGRGYVEMEAIIPVAVKPNIASIGGFCVIDSKTGRWINFDWEGFSGGANIDPEDNNQTEILKMEWELKAFDYDFFEDNAVEDTDESNYTNKTRFKELEELDNQDKLEEFLTSCEIDEVHYECYIGINEEVHIPMKITHFQIGDYEFSKEQLDRYNNKVKADEKDTVLRYIEEYFK